MSNPLLQLKGLLNTPTPPTHGRVVAVVGRSVHVATKKGAQVIDGGVAPTYKAGDEVVLVNGVIKARRTQTVDTPVFLL